MLLDVEAVVRCPNCGQVSEGYDMSIVKGDMVIRCRDCGKYVFSFSQYGMFERINREEPCV